MVTQGVPWRRVHSPINPKGGPAPELLVAVDPLTRQRNVAEASLLGLALWAAIRLPPGVPAIYTDAEVTASTWANVGNIFDRELCDTL